MPHFFEKRDPWGHGLGMWVVVCMAFSLPLAVWGVAQLQFGNDLERTLAFDTPQTRQLQWFYDHFGAEDRILVTWDGSAIEDPRVEQLARRLTGTPDADGIRRGGLKQIESVSTPGQLVEQMVGQQIDRDEAVNRVKGILAGPGPIWCQLSTTALNQRARTLRLIQEQAARKFGLQLKIEDRFGRIFEVEPEEDDSGSEATAPESTAASDVTIEQATAPEIASHDFQVSWPGMHTDPQAVPEFIKWIRELRIPVAGQRDGEAVLTDCFVHPGQAAVLAINLSEAGKADRAGTLDQVVRLAEQAGIAPQALHLSGPAVTSVALNQIASDAIWNSNAPWFLPQQRSLVFCLLLAGMALTYWLLRSVRHAVIACGVSCLSVVITMALVAVFNGSTSTVGIALSVLISVVTFSGAMRVIGIWRIETVRDPRTALERTLLSARKPRLLAAAALLAASSAFLFSPNPAVRQFGFYAALGTLVSLAAVLYGVPSLLQLWAGAPSEIAPAQLIRRPWTRIGRFVVCHSTAVCIVWGIALACCSYWLPRLGTETASIRGFRSDSRIVRDHEFLEENATGAVPIETLISFTREAREELHFARRMEIVREIEQKIRSLPQISGAISFADFHPVNKALSNKASLREKQADIDRAEELELAARKVPQAQTYWQLIRDPSDFNQAGDEIWRITGHASLPAGSDSSVLTSQMDVACRTVTKYYAGTRHVITGAAPVLLAGEQAAIDSFVYSSMIATALMAVVMAIATRGIVTGPLTMALCVAPLTIVVGLCTWLRMSFQPAVVMAGTAAVFLAIDFTLHVICDYRAGLVAGVSKRRAIVRALEQSGPTFWHTCGPIGLSTLLLLASPLLVLSRLASTLSTSMLALLFVEATLVPALLAGPLGWLIQRQVEKQRNKLKAVTEDPDPDDTLRHSAHTMPPKPQIAAESRPDSSSSFAVRDSRQRKRRR